MNAISAPKQIYCYLWFVGHQIATYQEISDGFDVSKSSFYDIVANVNLYLELIAAEYISWPTQAEFQATKDYYFQKHGFPNAIGTLDGTHLKMDRPKDSPICYYNRKGYFSLNAMILNDHNYKIYDFFIGYPGSVHDARVFDNSPLLDRLKTDNIGLY